MQGGVIAGFPDKGVEAKKLPVEMLEQLAELTETVMETQAAADEDFKKVYESQEAFAETYQVWKNLGYLPRDFGTGE